VNTGKFDIKVDGFDPYEQLTAMNRTFLESVYGHKVNAENFEDALKSIPEFKPNSILNFKFNHLGEMFELVVYTSRFANPIKKVPIPINVVKIFTAKKNMDDEADNGSSNNLVLNKSPLFALENSRTVIYKNEFRNSFQFAQCEKFFDAFKTSTNKSAGRSRLILDDVVVKDQMLWNEVDGKLYNMFELAFSDVSLDRNLSVLSCSIFGNNDDPKRIMMTAKLRTQAVKTAGEVNEFTHETPARIVFGDFEGFNYGDSIIISKSFAKRLESSVTMQRELSSDEAFQYLKGKYTVGDIMQPDDLADALGSEMYSNYRNIKIESLNAGSITVSAKIPFSVGDKITNFHGSKGIVSLIFEDNDMPYLKNDIGNFKAGPFDVIVSAISVYRRKALGQIFEAWARATNHLDVNNIQDAVKKYKHDMDEFAAKSVVVWHDHETIKPCGINMMIRLNHDAVSKISKSYLKTNYGKMLKLGEMELLNLASRGLYSIIDELDIRSVNKHYNSFSQIKEMQEVRTLPVEQANNLRFFNMLRTVGFDFNLRTPVNERDINPEFAKLQSMLTDQNVDLF
jgi:hypothetical protein